MDRRFTHDFDAKLPKKYAAGVLGVSCLSLLLWAAFWSAVGYAVYRIGNAQGWW
jgi:hypothetical protein